MPAAHTRQEGEEENGGGSGGPQGCVARKPSQAPRPFRPALLAGLFSRGGAGAYVTPGLWVTAALARWPGWRHDVTLH